MEARDFSLTLRRDEGYAYTIQFDDPALGVIRSDEPPPLGSGEGPNPVRLLGAAVGNCLAASLQYCLERAHVEPASVEARVEGSLFRNRDGRWRVGELRVLLEPTVAGAEKGRLDRCLELFEDFCVVTESVRNGVDVLVEVRPRYEEEGVRAADATPVELAHST